jgi:hypothetical protein
VNTFAGRVVLMESGEGTPHLMLAFRMATSVPRRP